MITQAQPPVYSQQSVAAMQENIYRLFAAVFYSQTNVQELPLTLKTYASGVEQTIRQMEISAAAYEGLSLLFAQTAATVEEAETVRLSFFTLAPFYGNIAATIGFDNAGRLSYRIVLYVYESLYQLNMDRYEKFGYSYLLQNAKAYEEEKKLLENEVGENNFVLAAQTLCALCSLTQSGLSDGIAAHLSDGEVLTLIQAQKSSSLALSEQGWNVLFSCFSKLDGQSYAAEFLALAQKNGDINQICARMNGLFALLSAVQSKFTIQQTALLRSGLTEQLIHSVFSAFGESEWALFEELTTLSLSDDYNALAAQRFGDDYTAYRANILVRPLSELKAAVGTTDFFTILEGYAAGVCPAVAYGLFR